MKIEAHLGDGKLLFPDRSFFVSNNVRTVRDGTRRYYEVVRSVPGGYPYDPCPFPAGLWLVTGVEWQKDRGFDFNTYGPVKIKTDAWRMVNVWELDDEGDYLRQTDVLTRDTCYWLHYSAFNTTLGCIRLSSPEDAVAVANRIVSVLGSGESVFLEVAE